MIIVKVCFFFTVFLVLENAVALPSHFFRGKQIPNLSAGEQTAITLRSEDREKFAGMVLKTSRIFSLLLVVSVATLLLFLSWGSVSKSIR